MYQLMYQGLDCEPEEIDEAETKEEAQYLLGEYRTAFGSTCKLWIQKEAEA